MSRWLENPIFCHRVLNLILFDDNFFLENFNCIQVIWRFLTTENNFSKSTLSQNFQELEIFKGLKKAILVYKMVKKLQDHKTTCAWFLWALLFTRSFFIISPLLLINLTWPSLVLMVIIPLFKLSLGFCLFLCLNLSRKLPLSKSFARLLNSIMSVIVLSGLSEWVTICFGATES